MTDLDKNGCVFFGKWPWVPMTVADTVDDSWFVFCLSGLRDDLTRYPTVTTVMMTTVLSFDGT